MLSTFDALTRQVVSDHRFDDCKHDRIVGPNAAIYKPVATGFEWTVDSWGRGCCQRDLHHLLAPILLVIAMVTGFE
jgi:hypothetical protein